VFFDDRAFVDTIAKSQGMTVYGQSGDVVMQIDLSAIGEAIPYARKCEPVGG